MQSGHRYLLPKHGAVPLKENDTVIRVFSNNAPLLAGPVASLLFPFLMLLSPSRLGNGQRWWWLIVSIALAAMNVWLYWW